MKYKVLVAPNDGSGVQKEFCVDLYENSDEFVATVTESLQTNDWFIDHWPDELDPYVKYHKDGRQNYIDTILWEALDITGSVLDEPDLNVFHKWMKEFTMNLDDAKELFSKSYEGKYSDRIEYAENYMIRNHSFDSEIWYFIDFKAYAAWLFDHVVIWIDGHVFKID